MHHLTHADPVIADQTDVVRNADSLGGELPKRAKTAGIIRTKDAGWLFFQLEQFMDDPGRLDGIVEVSIPHISDRNPDPEFRADLIKAGHALTAGCAFFAPDESDPAVTKVPGMADHLFDTGSVIAEHTVTTFIDVIDDDRRNAAGSEANDSGIIKVCLQHDDSVQAALAGMFVITVSAPVQPAEEGQVIAVRICFAAQIVDQGTEILMIHPVLIEDTEIA